VLGEEGVISLDEDIDDGIADADHIETFRGDAHALMGVGVGMGEGRQAW
jgi:hypothetical protein